MVPGAWFLAPMNFVRPMVVYFLLLGTVLFFAAAQGLCADTHEQWQGSFVLWKRAPCDSGLNCALPEAFSPTTPVLIDFVAPGTPGSHLIAHQKWTFGSWIVDLMMIWVNPTNDAKDPAYLVTQTSLREAKLGVVAECSRYDGVDEIHFLPPGSCSGRSGDQMFGVSLLSPTHRTSPKIP